MTYQWGYSPAMTRAKAMLAVAWSDGKDESHSQCCVPYGQKSPWPFPCFTTPPPAFQRKASGAEVGLDMGVAASITTSDGVHLWIPTLLSAGEAQRKHRLQRQLSRQQKGSNRRAYTRRCMARLAAKEADRRRNWIEKTTTQLVRDFDLIVIEDLRVKNMIRSAKGTVAN